ncbi:protein FAM161B isoform X2 [Caloenas nicobarica]|uniref:protein FAM161B isoform X2 n=1 Tax=Caloenas nicobarica TaxID=187106 RepID=UPI0032B72AA0
MGGRCSPSEPGLPYQEKLKGDLGVPEEDEELEGFRREAAVLRDKLWEALSHTSGNKRQSSSLIDLTSDSTWDQQKPHLFPKSRLRPKSASSPWIPSITIPQPFKMTLREAHQKSQLMKSYMFLELDKQRDKRQSQDEAECQKQFRAQPVPAHVFLPLYQEIMEQNEIRRQIATQKRKELLLATQRPFSFLEKEEKKKEAIRQKFLAAATTNESSKQKQVSKKVPKSTYDALLGDKLKVHITDATRKRESALRYSQDSKKEGNKEGMYWLEKQKKKCQAIQKSVNSRAKALDPHRSLEETHKEKSKQNWQNMRARTKEYSKELEEMQLRVKNRPYLFEQVTKHDARQGAERRYRHTLQQVGLSEEFVKKKGKDATDLLEEESDVHRAPKPQGEKDNCTVQEGEPQEEQSGKQVAT